METARCLLQDLQITHKFWGYAVLTAAHIHNRIPSQSHNDTSPMEFWTGQPPTIGHLHVFGSTAWVHVPKEKRRKLEAKSIKGIFVGYEEEAGTKVYRIYDPKAKQVMVARDVIIDESNNVSPDTVTDNLGQKTTIDWEPESQIPTVNPEISNEVPSEYDRLDPVTPLSETQEPVYGAEMRDSIVLRPLLAITQNRKES